MRCAVLRGTLGVLSPEVSLVFPSVSQSKISALFPNQNLHYKQDHPRGPSTLKSPTLVQDTHQQVQIKASEIADLPRPPSRIKIDPSSVSNV